MDTKKRTIRKSYRISQEAQNNIDELISHINNKNSEYGYSQITEADLFDEAISYYHSHTLGGDVKDYAVQKMETIIQSNLELLMNKHMEPFAQALNHLNNTTSKTLDAAYILMYYGELLPKDQQFINELLIGTESYHRVLEEANRVKQKMMGDE